MNLRIINTGLKMLQESRPDFLRPALAGINVLQVRNRRTKHWNPKWKLFRSLKVIKVDIPNYNEKWEDLSKEEVRSRMKEAGMLPPRPWMEQPVFISATGGIFEPYVPPEGDGKVSSITMQGAKQKLQYLEKKSKTMMAVRKIRSFDEDFDTPEFCKLAEKIYIKMHECMAEKNLDNLSDYVTERAYPEVIHNTKCKTIHWKHIKNIELPCVVHARCTDIITKDNIFAQVTVRFHTQQMLAIYDRFGRLMHGSEILSKDVIEYVVFEKHLANEYGTWRIHDKIIPDWVPPKEPLPKTYKQVKFEIQEEKPQDSKELQEGTKALPDTEAKQDSKQITA